jgi:hypothetical protein
MSSLAISGSVLLLMLISLPLLVIGAMSDNAGLQIFGVVILGLAAAAPPVLRFTSVGEEEQK